MPSAPSIHGAKKQPKSAQKPYIAPDSFSSSQTASIVYGISEGEIAGLVAGGKSIKLDGTPLMNDDGQANFIGVHWQVRNGTLDQEHLSGFPSVQNESSINVEVKSSRPFVKAYRSTALDALIVRLACSAIYRIKDNGDKVGHRVEYAIDLQSDGGVWREVMTGAIDGKVSQGYARSHRIDLPSAKRGWTLRVRRITPNRDSDLIGDTMSVEAVTEIIDAKLRYPATAVLGLSYDAETFSSIAKLAVRAKGLIIQVPSNYNPETRQYTGLWDGRFKLAYSNNPAWVYYDLCTHKRYGLGERLAGLVDKWSLYRLAQYCDELVDDGKGGTEPRFTCNVYIQKAEDAYQILQNIASVFRAMSYWDGAQVVLDADIPKDPVYTFSRANVVDGRFTYTGTRARDRHSVVKVAWDNPDNEYKTEYEFVRDERAIAKYGIRMLDVAAFGCTSQGQAQRQGQWALLSEQLETAQVNFKTGLEGFIPQVGQVINIADDVFAGRAISGRIESVNGKQITLDRPAGKVGDTLSTQNGSARIVSVRGQTVTLQTALNVAVDTVWAVISDDLKLRQFRVMSVKQNEDLTFDITALQYEPRKFSGADTGARIEAVPYSAIEPNIISAPTTVTISTTHKVSQGINITTLTIAWAQVKGAVAYQLEWRKDDGNWINAGKLTGLSHDIDGVYAGNYIARVIAIDAFDNHSQATSSQLTQIQGKTGKPPRLARLTATGILFGMDLAWVFNAGSDDTAYTEIEVSPDGRSNIAALGQFAYPTNKHEITGLQGNLTQHYRARIVDKLGNTSDWTAWVKGTTSAQADKVLDLIQGQVNQSHLHQTLSTPIGKIGSLETAVAGVNGQLGTLNQSLATAQRELNTTKQHLATAQNTLNTAVANIITESNRITSAIRDIGTLQSANTARTAEIANLTQTVNGHTSSIRELGVTTGDLAQKYSQIKTQADKSTSDITQIKQTQSGQATSIERLNSEMANKASTASLNTMRETLVNADTALGRRIDAVSGEFKQADTAIKASIQSESQARSSADNALSSRINALDSKFTTADNAIKASVAQAQQTATSAQQAVATAQSQLNARIDGIDVGGRNLLLATNQSKALAGENRVNQSNVMFYAFSKQPFSQFAQTDFILSFDWEVQGVNVAGMFRPEFNQHPWSAGFSQISVGQNNKKGRYISKVSHRDLATTTANFLKFRLDHFIGTLVVSNAKLEIGTVPTDWTPAPEDVQADIDSKASTASLDEFKQAQATQTQATAQKLAQLESSLGTKATAAALNQTNTKVAQVDGKLTAEANKTTTLQTTVNGHTASIQQHAQAINGLNAQWTLKVESGGIVSGIGLASSNGKSAFAVRANQFYVADPTGTNKRPLFSVQATTQTVNGVVVQKGSYLDSAFIANGSITNAKIAHAAIDSAKIKDGAIDNAKIANAAITTAKIGAAQIDTLQIAGEAVIVPRAQRFDADRLNGAGELFSLSMDSKGAPILLDVSLDISSYLTHVVDVDRDANVTISAQLERYYRIEITCNGALVVARRFCAQAYREKRVTGMDSNSSYSIRASTTNQLFAIANFIHTPNAPAVYKVRLHHESGEGHHVLHSGAILAMAIKR